MTINLYNESTSAYNHTKLSSRPVSVEISGIGLSVPNGTLKLNYNKYFTHVVFALNGVTWICKVDNRVSLGGDLMQIDYSIDYAKDYFNKYGLLNQDICVERSTSLNLWRKFVVDNDYPTTTQINYTTAGGALAYTVNTAVMVVINYTPENGNINGADAYVMDIKNWGLMQKSLLNPFVGSGEQRKPLPPEYITSAIKGVYLIPFKNFDSDYGGVTLSIQHNISIYAKDLDDETKVKSYDVDVGAAIYKMTAKTSGFINGFTVDYQIKPNIIDTPQSWLDVQLKKYVAYAPFYGAFEVNPQRYDGIFYKISPYSGELGVTTINNSSAELLNMVRLPEIAYVSNSAVTQQRILNAQTAASVSQSLLQGALSLTVTAVGAITGNAALTGMGVAQLAAGVGGNIANTLTQQNVQKQIISMSALNFTNTSGTLGTLLPAIMFVKATTAATISMQEFANRQGVYCDYKLTDSIPDDLKGRRVWFNLTGARIKGEQWYAASVYNALNGQCFILDP